MTEPHVFISYDRTDQGAAEQVRARLLASQIKTWMDRYDIPAGAYWPDEIDVGLRQATLILGLLSPEAVNSRNVKNEWDWAIHNAKPLILLKIRPSETPHRYVSINYIDATKQGLDTALDQLMRIPDLQSAPGPVVAASTPGPEVAASAASPVVAVPRTEYVERGGLTIAYHVFGAGDVDLVYVPGSVSHVEQLWKLPAMAAFLRGLASFSRVMLVDVRGTGMSARPARIASLEERMDDLCAVMDACQSKRAVVFGVSGGAPSPSSSRRLTRSERAPSSSMAAAPPTFGKPTTPGPSRSRTNDEPSRPTARPSIRRGERGKRPERWYRAWRLRRKTMNRL